MSHSSVQRPVSLGSQVADILRQRIVRGDLPPGHRLTEEGLAEEFQVSRGPIRDAITLLTFETLVTTHRPRGIYIVGFSADDAEQLYSLREALESLALRRAMRVTDDDRWAPMWACAERMRTAADRRDPAAFSAADLEFHTQIYALANHPRLASAWQQYMPTFAALLDVTIRHDADLHESAEAHVHLYEAMRSGDVDVALTVLSSHLDGAEQRMRLELASRQSTQ